MGISAGIIYNSDAPKKENALCIYEVQLFFNVLWSLAFFNFRAISVSIGIILILWVLIILMIRSFYKISPLAAYLQIPYLIWVTFATYLNIAIYILNK
jgi:tryptophan-rich sensory protein